MYIIYGIKYIPINNDTKLNLNDLVFNNDATIIIDVTNIESPNIALTPYSLE